MLINQCIRNNSSCWFVHTEEVVENMDVDNETASAEATGKADSLVFCKAAEKTPPDQIEKLMEMMKMMMIMMKKQQLKTE